MIEKIGTSQQSHPPEDSFEAMRTAVRFPLALHVDLRTEVGSTQALTRDVSAAGIQFQMSHAPRIGSMLEWSMHLPGNIMGTPDDITVACVGRVVWAASSGDHVHVGAVIDQYVFKGEAE